MNCSVSVYNLFRVDENLNELLPMVNIYKNMRPLQKIFLSCSITVYKNCRTDILYHKQKLPQLHWMVAYMNKSTTSNIAKIVNTTSIGGNIMPELSITY